MGASFQERAFLGWCQTTFECERGRQKSFPGPANLIVYGKSTASSLVMHLFRACDALIRTSRAGAHALDPFPFPVSVRRQKVFRL